MKIFLPGPTQVAPDVLAQLAKPLIGHRTSEFQQLLQQISPDLQQLFFTNAPVFCCTGVASAALDAALANAGGERILILSNGAFGERWLQSARQLGFKADAFDPGWGRPFPDYEVRRVLDWGRYDTLVLVHGETSTGMLNPIAPISALLAQRPDVLLIVDAVTTLGGVELRMDDWEIDVLVGGVQKCLALPPGIVPVGVSVRALQRSSKSQRKGYAWDFSLWRERWERGEVVGTPAIPQFFALDYQLQKIKAETLQQRWQRHRRLSEITKTWAQEHGFTLFAPEGHELPPVSCLRPLQQRDVNGLVEKLKQNGYLIDGGYGKLKGKALRIGHLGDWQEADLLELLDALAQLL